MKLTIDTKEDSVEDIRKVMHILSDILARKGGGAVTETVDTTPMMNMFSDAPPAVPECAPDFSSFQSLSKQVEEKKVMETPRVELY